MDEKSMPTPDPNQLGPQKEDQLPLVDNTSEVALTSNQSSTSPTNTQQAIKTVNSVKVFISYAHADLELRRRLEDHLSSLSYSGKITIWQDQEIPAGADWEEQIGTHINEADLILLLVSSNFIASKYCWNREVVIALERHKAGTARVIPIILKPALWEDTPLGQLQALPTGAKPVTQWEDPDIALKDVARGIRKVLDNPPLQESFIQQHAKLRRAILIRGAGVISAIAGIGIGIYFLTPRDSPKTPLPGPLFTPQDSPKPSPTGSLVYSYRGHWGYVSTVAWSPNGQHIASGGTDKTVQVWDAPNGGNVYTYRGHTDLINGIVWSPDSRYVASASRDHTVRVWDTTANGGSPFIYQGHTGLVWDVAWSPDGKRIASSAGGTFDETVRDATVQVWDAPHGGNVYTYRGHDYWVYVYAVAWSPNGQFIASGSNDGTVLVWNAADGKNISTYKKQSSIFSVAWSPNGKLIASGSTDRTVHVWDATTGKTVFICSGGHSQSVRNVAWSPNGQSIASAGYDGIVQLWDAINGNIVYTYRGHSAAVSAVAWSPDGQFIASGSDDQTVQVWEAKR